MKYRIVFKMYETFNGYEPQVKKFIPTWDGYGVEEIWEPIAGDKHITEYGSYLSSLPRTSEEAGRIISKHLKEYRKSCSVSVAKDIVVKEFNFVEP
jgi:hypothetical protein